MPTVLRRGPYRFFFYAGDGEEPPHVHVERDDCEAKLWLDPIRLVRNHGFGGKVINRIRELVERHQHHLLESRMRSSGNKNLSAQATRVGVSEDTLSVDLADGRTIAAPLAWYPRLCHATAEERNSWRLIAGGRGIHWPALDEDISVLNLLEGQQSAESQSSL